MSNSLTIAIPTKNSAERIVKCIQSIGNNFAIEIVVIDSQSTDKTAEIAIELGAKVLQFHWNGKYPKKRNWFLMENTPKTDWILFLDDDEILTEKSKLAITKAISQTGINAFWLNYSVYNSDKKLNWGYPLKKLALFKTDAGFFEKIEEDFWSSLDMEIHEHPIINGPIGSIKEKLEHKVNFNEPGWQPKHLEYAKWEAKRFLNLSSNNKDLTILQKIKYTILKSPAAGFFFFLGSYILLGGFMDGKNGLKYAYHKACYFNWVYKAIQREKYIGFEKK